MSVTPNAMVSWCRKLLGADPNCPKLPLEQYLKGIPRMECLGKLPSGTPVLIRGDVDAKPGAKVGEGDIRLRSMKDTLQVRPREGLEDRSFSGTSAASRKNRSIRSPPGSAKSSAAR